jgi:hypothetical protein
MSITVTPEEIEKFRDDLAGYAEALFALDEIEACDGDLEDAAIALAIRVGQEPDTNEGWIEGLAKRWRHVICQSDLKQELEDGLNGDVLTALAEATLLPLMMATPIAIYVLKTGIDPFCQSLVGRV